MVPETVFEGVVARSLPSIVGTIATVIETVIATGTVTAPMIEKHTANVTEIANATEIGTAIRTTIVAVIAIAIATERETATGTEIASGTVKEEIVNGTANETGIAKGTETATGEGSPRTAVPPIARGLILRTGQTNGVNAAATITMRVMAVRRVAGMLAMQQQRTMNRVGVPMAVLTTVRTDAVRIDGGRIVNVAILARLPAMVNHMLVEMSMALVLLVGGMVAHLMAVASLNGLGTAVSEAFVFYSRRFT